MILRPVRSEAIPERRKLDNLVLEKGGMLTVGEMEILERGSTRHRPLHPHYRPILSNGGLLACSG